ASFANNIIALKNAGCKIIVDDVVYFDEPFFQDGIVAQAVDTVKAAGVAYFSSAGNDAAQAFEALTYAETTIPDAVDGVTSGWFNFAPSGSPANARQKLTLQPNQFVVLAFQWDSPIGATLTDLDIYAVDSGTTNISVASKDRNLQTAEPFELLVPVNTTG